MVPQKYDREKSKAVTKIERKSYFEMTEGTIYLIFKVNYRMSIGSIFKKIEKFYKGTAPHLTFYRVSLGISTNNSTVVCLMNNAIFKHAICSPSA